MQTSNTYQFSGIFTGTNAMGEETGIAIGFAKVWSNYSKSIPLSIIMGMEQRTVLPLKIPLIFRQYLYRLKKADNRKGSGCQVSGIPERIRCINAHAAVVTLLVFALFLLSNLYSPKNTAFFGFDYAYRCMGIYTPNPFWNATYLATRQYA